MATSDSPLSVPNVTLAVARGVGAPEEIIISGSGFGAAPNVVLWRTLKEGVDGQSVQAEPPEGEVGTLSNLTEGAAYKEFNGRMTFQALVNGSQYKAQYLHGSEFQRFRHHLAIAVPDTGWFPGVNNIGLRTLPSDSGWKPVWVMKGNSGNLTGNGEADICLPTHIGNGSFSASGNSVAPDFTRFISSATDSEWRWNDFNGFDWLQVPDLSNPKSLNGLLEAGVIADTGNTAVVRTDVSPFAGNDSSVTDANAAYDRIKYNPYARSSEGNAAGLFSDFYLAVESSPGANDFRQCAYLGNNSVFENCTVLRPVKANSWTDTEVRVPNPFGLPHYHIVKPDGSVISGSTL